MCFLKLGDFIAFMLAVLFTEISPISLSVNQRSPYKSDIKLSLISHVASCECVCANVHGSRAAAALASRRPPPAPRGLDTVGSDGHCSAPAGVPAAAGEAVDWTGASRQGVMVCVWSGSDSLLRGKPSREYTTSHPNRLSIFSSFGIE